MLSSGREDRNLSWVIKSLSQPPCARNQVLLISCVPQENQVNSGGLSFIICKMGIPTYLFLKLTYAYACKMLQISDSTSGNEPKRIENRYLNRYLSTHVYSSIIHNHRKVKITQCPLTDKQINKYGISLQWNITQP